MPISKMGVLDWGLKTSRVINKVTIWNNGVNVNKGKDSSDWAADIIAGHMVSDSLVLTKL